jgi:acetyl esterase
VIPDAMTIAVPSTRQRIEGRVARLLSGLPGAWLQRLIDAQPLVVDGQTLDAHTQFILSVRNRLPARLMTEPTVEAGRRRYQRDVLAATVQAGARPTRVRAVRDIRIDGHDAPLRARHYQPALAEGEGRAPILLYLHGGGFVNGNITTHDEPCRLLCHHGHMHVVSVEYRLAPEHPYPAPIHDAAAALAWVQREADALGADPQRVLIGGDSAGANLATVAALDAAAQDRAPAAQLLIYPALDMASTFASRALFGRGYMLTSEDMDAFSRLYLGDLDATDAGWRASPLRATTLHQAPPALIVTAGFDPLRDEGEAYAERLCANGRQVILRRYSGLVHGFLHMTSIVPCALTATVDIAHRLRALADSHPSS